VWLAHKRRTTLSSSVHQTGTPRSWASSEALGSRWLVVSNAPESIHNYGAGPRTLYKVRIPIPASGQLDLRTYLWHVNKTGAQRYIAFMLRFEDASTAWSYSGFRKEDAAQGIVAAEI